MNTASVSQSSIDQSFDGSEWLSVAEAASYLRILRKDGSPCVERVRNLVNQGKLPFYKPFGRLLFKRPELSTLIESSRNGAFKCR
jgi:excisionase family DNA binding protein